MENITSYQFFKDLKKLPFIEKIVIYGSRSRGDYDPRSDIDLAIVCPTASSEDWFKILEIIEEADTLLKLDCVRYDQLTNIELKESIQKQGIELYRKKNT